MSKLEIVYKKIGALKKYENNSREHSEEQIQKVADSINEFGFTNPVLTYNGVIVAGHCRYEAAKIVNLKEIPTISLDHLSEDQRAAYVIADNQLALGSTWNMDILRVEVETLLSNDFDTELLGFDDLFMDRLLDDIPPENFDDLDSGGAGSCEFKVSCDDESELEHIKKKLGVENDKISAIAFLQILDNRKKPKSQ
jgi:hypothetical protein